MTRNKAVPDLEWTDELWQRLKALPLWTTQETAAFFRCTVAEWDSKTSRPHHVRVGRVNLYSKADIIHWLRLNHSAEPFPLPAEWQPSDKDPDGGLGIF